MSDSVSPVDDVEQLLTCSRMACSDSAPDLANRISHVVETVIESNSAAVWNSMPTLRRMGPSSDSESWDVLAGDRTSPRSGFEQTVHVLEQHALAGSASAENDECFATPKFEV